MRNLIIFILYKIILKLINKKTLNNFKIKSFEVYRKNYTNYAFFKSPKLLEFKCLDFVLKKLKKRRNCIDIGAEIGSYSILFSSYYKEVISYEPVKNSFITLKFNIKNYKNIKIFNYAIGNKKKKIIYKPEFNYGGSSVLNKNKNFEKEIIKYKSFPKKISYSKKIDLIKIDTEGDEYNVVKSLINSNVFKHNDPLILIEKSKKYNLNTMRLLKKIGYLFCYEIGCNKKSSNNFLYNIFYFVAYIFKSCFILLLDKKMISRLPEIDNNKTYSNLLLSKKSLDDLT